MTTNRAIKVTGVPSQYAWHWCELHFSKGDSWKLDEYTCPLLIEENIDGKVPNTDGVPKAFIDKSLQDMYEAYNKDAPPGVDMYDWLKQYAKQFEQRSYQNGIICRAVRQNIIAEICVPYGSNKFPEFEVWAFLQPATIGRKSTMKVIGYVCDDWPKGGWFHMQARNFSQDPAKYEPYLCIPDETGKGFKAVRKLEWKKTTEASQTSRLHARSTVEGEKAERYLIKLDVVVTNPQTPEDKARKDEAKKKVFEQIWKTNKEKGAPVDEETLKQLLRFETGSYLKIWIRNIDYLWARDIADVDDDENMLMMQVDDGPRVEYNDAKITGNILDKTWLVKHKELSELLTDSKFANEYFFNSPAGYFKPYTWRNHTWKRNKFTKTGAWDDNELHHVGLWPEEVLEAVENLDGYLFAETDGEIKWPFIFIVSAVYVAFWMYMYKYMTGLEEKVKANPKNKSLKDFLDKVLGSSDIPQAAAIFAYYGFPDPDNKWGDKPMTFGTLVERFGKEKESSTTLLFLDFFYGLIQQLVLGALKAQDPKSTKELLVTVMGNNKLWQTDFKKFEKELSLLERKFKVTLVGDKRIKRLGGGQLPPPYLVWVAYAFSFKMAYGLETELTFDELPEMGLNSSLKGDAGFYFDIGAIWTMTRELGVAYSGIDYKKDKEKKDEEPPSHPFEKALYQILDFADLQIGAAIKLVAEGNLNAIIDLFSRGKDVKRLKFDPENPPSFVVKLEAPIYSKFSKIQLKYKCMRCDLMFWTGSAIAFMPTGLYLGDNLVWNGKDGMRYLFDKNIGMGEVLYLKSPKKEFVVGEPILCTLDVTAKLVKQKAGEGVSYFQTYFQLGDEGDKIELDTKAVAGSKLELHDSSKYDKGINLTSSFVFQPSKLATDAKYQAFVKKLIREGNGGEFLCRYAGDLNRTTIPPHPRIVVKPPRIGQFAIDNEKQVFRFEDVVKIRFNLLNCMQKDISIYCTVVEDTNGNLFHCTGKQGKPSYFKCFFIAEKNQYGCNVPLYELAEIKRKLPEIGDWDICFRISLDTKAEFTLLFDNTGKDCSKDIQVKKD